MCACTRRVRPLAAGRVRIDSWPAAEAAIRRVTTSAVTWLVCVLCHCGRRSSNDERRLEIVAARSGFPSRGRHHRRQWCTRYGGGGSAWPGGGGGGGRSPLTARVVAAPGSDRDLSAVPRDASSRNAYTGVSEDQGGWTGRGVASARTQDRLGGSAGDQEFRSRRGAARALPIAMRSAVAARRPWGPGPSHTNIPLLQSCRFTHAHTFHADLLFTNLGNRQCLHFKNKLVVRVFCTRK